MKTIHTTSHIGPDGLLNLQLPVGLTNADVTVTVVVEPSACPVTPKPLSREEWLKFVEETAGRWEGEPFERPDQGQFEIRESF